MSLSSGPPALALCWGQGVEFQPAARLSLIALHPSGGQGWGTGEEGRNEGPRGGLVVQ